MNPPGIPQKLQEAHKFGAVRMRERVLDATEAISHWVLWALVWSYSSAVRSY